MSSKSLLWALSWVPVGVTFTQVVGQLSWIQGTSMQPALNPDTSLGTRDLVWLRRYGLHRPGVLRSGDVVVFRSPLDPHKIMVKRILAMSGDLVHPRAASKYPRDEVRVPVNHVWLEGDNIHSVDSNTFGPVSTGLIFGRVSYILFPPSRFGDVPAGGRNPYTP